MEEYDSLHQANIDGESKERPKPQDADLIRLLAEWIAIDHDKTRLQWEQYLTEAQELADYLHVIGYRRCPEPWPVLSPAQLAKVSRVPFYGYAERVAKAQRDADWKACHKEGK